PAPARRSSPAQLPARVADTTAGSPPSSMPRAARVLRPSAPGPRRSPRPTAARRRLPPAPPAPATDSSAGTAPPPRPARTATERCAARTASWRPPLGRSLQPVCAPTAMPPPPPPPSPRTPPRRRPGSSTAAAANRAAPCSAPLPLGASRLQLAAQILEQRRVVLFEFFKQARYQRRPPRLGIGKEAGHKFPCPSPQ